MNEKELIQEIIDRDRTEQEYNDMLRVLRTIAVDFETYEELQISCDAEYGVDYVEALEMAYDNMRGLARDMYYRLSGGKK